MLYFGIAILQMELNAQGGEAPWRAALKDSRLTMEKGVHSNSVLHFLVEDNLFSMKRCNSWKMENLEMISRVSTHSGEQTVNSNWLYKQRKPILTLLTILWMNIHDVFLFCSGRWEWKWKKDIRLRSHLLEHDCFSLCQQLRIEQSKTNTQTPGKIRQTITF